MSRRVERWHHWSSTSSHDISRRVYSGVRTISLRRNKEFLNTFQSSGLTLGRVGLLWVNRKVRWPTPQTRRYNIASESHPRSNLGRRTARHLHLRDPRHLVRLFSFLSCERTLLRPLFLPSWRRLELVIWLVRSLIGGAIPVSFIGVQLGPIYPNVMKCAGRVLPSWLLTDALGGSPA